MLWLRQHAATTHQGGVQGFAGPVDFAQRREADAVVGQQPRIVRQGAQRLLMVRPRIGGPPGTRPGLSTVKAVETLDTQNQGEAMAAPRRAQSPTSCTSMRSSQRT